MKKVVSMVLILFLISACNMPAGQRAESQGAAPSVVVEATATEAQSATQSALAPQTTALPLDINAPLVDGPSIDSIAMMDTVNGWAITDTQIIRTNDGGVTWYNVTPQGVTETGYSVTSQFLDPTHAWLQFADPNNYPHGGTMYRTSDGGLTWQSNATPFSSGDISFIDTNNGWMMADLGVGTGNMAVSIFQTSDGGATWNRAFTNDPNLEGSGDSLPLGGLKNGIVPINMQRAWIYGVTYSTGTPYLFRTDDGGKTWSLVPLTLSVEAQAAELSVDKMRFMSPAQGILIMRITSPQTKMVVYQTNDGGNTWSPAIGTTIGGGVADIVSAQEIVFYGTNQFYVTKDASATWNTVSPDVAFDDSMNAMDFVSPLIGWVIKSDPSNHHTLYKTENGGVTWSLVIP